MYIVLELNRDEFGQGNSRPVHKFSSKSDLDKFVLSYRGDVSRLEIFEGRKMVVNLEIK